MTIKYQNDSVEKLKKRLYLWLRNSRAVFHTGEVPLYIYHYQHSNSAQNQLG